MDKNKYLEKIFSWGKEEKKKDKPTLLGVGTTALLGAGIAAGSPQKLLGYHTLYHGTSKDIASKVKVEGFNPSHGGTRNAAVNEQFAKNSAGKIHFTKNKLMARMYAGRMDKHFPPGKGLEDADWKGLAKEYMNNGKVIKTRVPDYKYKKFRVDGDTSSLMDEMMMGKEEAKATASTTSTRVPPKFVAGGKGSYGPFNFLKKKHLSTYLSSASGKARFKGGLMQLGIGAGLMGLAAHNNKQRTEDDSN